VGERFLLRTHTATMGSVSLRVLMKSRWCSWNRNRRFALSLITFFSFTLQYFAADNSKAGAASPAADKELATFGNGIFCVFVAFL